MIYDSLDQLARYAKLAPQTWGKIETFLAGCTAATAVGRYEIDGERVYASVQEYETHAPNAEKLEIHRKYIDIQLLLDGEELIAVRAVNDLDVTLPYDAGRDVAFYRLPENDFDAVLLRLVPGRFALFYPEEGHMPGLAAQGGNSRVVKVVIKIDAALL